VNVDDDLLEEHFLFLLSESTVIDRPDVASKRRLICWMVQVEVFALPQTL
jgi:hypothetical protein